MFKLLNAIFNKPPEEMKSMQASVSSRIKEAEKYLGKSEAKNRKELTKFLGMDPTVASWCAAFVNAIEKACGGKGTGSLGARSYLRYGTATKTPVPGDIVVFWREKPTSWKGHVAYFVSQDENYVKVLGGNQDNKVCYKLYERNRVLSYRRP